ncbi:hypothetical protein SAMN06265222_105218 [Neorhodopirellula lusitana]|uniref:Uncharacterized protein n=1 Tax=Neorhodopirellula lusitana TaxID=445327 RepID=A0ABY1Q390_9BACT|nr:hypothetical protein SAMN06265222_105218 [Neorhodopirellula lusitana]
MFARLVLHVRLAMPANAVITLACLFCQTWGMIAFWQTGSRLILAVEAEPDYGLIRVMKALFKQVVR